jgi:L-alanine-DL-glutamate epimerase-like enolase superfamily enzyme
MPVPQICTNSVGYVAQAFLPVLFLYDNFTASMMEGAPQVDKEGHMNLPQGPGWGVSINNAMLG